MYNILDPNSTECKNKNWRGKNVDQVTACVFLLNDQVIKKKLSNMWLHYKYTSL